MNNLDLQLKCIIVDDEKYARDLINHFLKAVDFIEVVASCKNVPEAVAALQQEKIDLIFLDVQMPHKTGIEFLSEYRIESKVVLTTAFAEYATQGYDLDVLDYLLKPVLKDRFDRCIDKVRKTFTLEEKAFTYDAQKTAEERSIIIKSGYDTHKIRLIDIEYIESVGEYIRYHTAQTKYLVLNSLTEMEKELPAPFMRVHRSYIIPLDKVTGKAGYTLQLSCGVSIPIGKTYRSKMKGIDLFSRE